MVDKLGRTQVFNTRVNSDEARLAGRVELRRQLRTEPHAGTACHCLVRATLVKVPIPRKAMNIHHLMLRGLVSVTEVVLSKKLWGRQKILFGPPGGAGRSGRFTVVRPLWRFHLHSRSTTTKHLRALSSQILNTAVGRQSCWSSLKQNCVRKSSATQEPEVLPVSKHVFSLSLTLQASSPRLSASSTVFNAFQC